MLCKQGITLARLKLCNWGRQSAVGAIINSHCQRTGMTSPGDPTQLTRVKGTLELSTIQQATLNSIAHHSRNHRHAAAPDIMSGLLAAPINRVVQAISHCCCHNDTMPKPGNTRARAAQPGEVPHRTSVSGDDGYSVCMIGVWVVQSMHNIHQCTTT